MQNLINYCEKLFLRINIFLRKCYFLILIFFLCMSVQAQARSNLMLHIKSPYHFEQTVKRIEDGLIQANMHIFAQIDHQAAARSVGLSMPKTLVLIYGNPKGGTAFMLQTPDLALDLPLKVLVREDEKKQVWVVLHRTAHLAKMHGIPADKLKKLAQAESLIIKILGRN